MVLRAVAEIEGAPLCGSSSTTLAPARWSPAICAWARVLPVPTTTNTPRTSRPSPTVIVNGRVVVRRFVILGAGDDGAPSCECTEQSGSADREQHASRHEVGETVEVVVGASIGAEDRVVTKRWRRRRTDPGGRSGGEQFAEARGWRGELEPPCAGDIQGGIVHQHDAVDDSASR